MSLQDKILEKLDPLKRTLFKERLKQSGNEHRVLRLQVTVDDFDDETDISIIGEPQEITIEMELPDSIPMSRLRRDLTRSYSKPTSSLYLYDILPITLRSSFDYDLQKNDIIIKKFKDEKDESKYFYLVLQITEVLGDPSPNSLVNISFNVSPYTRAFTQEIADAIYKY